MQITLSGRSGFAILLLFLVQPAAVRVYTVDPHQSRLEIEVFRGGLLKGLGHNHTISAGKFTGVVQLDPANLMNSSISLSIDSKSLVVLDPGAAEKERADIQATMEGPKVLDAQAFPGITFTSTQVRKAAQTENGFEIMLTGRLDLHGIKKVITFPVHIRYEKNLLQATGTAMVNQTDFGIAPIRLAGGTVRVKDQVRVSFDIKAKPDRL